MTRGQHGMQETTIQLISGVSAAVRLLPEEVIGPQRGTT
jgi:hypothetical protein